MQLIARNDINDDKWNRRIAMADQENIFSYTWYLDAVAENWVALIDNENYSTILPIAYTSRLGIKRMYQAPFTREYTIFGNGFEWAEAIPFLEREFRALDFRSEKKLSVQGLERTHQILGLSPTNYSDFSKNAIRLIKKSSKKYKINPGSKPDIILDLFRENVAHKIDTIGEKDLVILNQLMENAIANNQGKILVATNEENQIVASIFALIDKQTITYLKGAATDESKKNGVMYALMASMIDHFQTTHQFFDFGGSDIESIANFFKKFGAVDRKYYNYTLDNTPFWFKIIKKIKR